MGVHWRGHGRDGVHRGRVEHERFGFRVPAIPRRHRRRGRRIRRGGRRRRARKRINHIKIQFHAAPYNRYVIAFSLSLSLSLALSLSRSLALSLSLALSFYPPAL